MRVYGQLQNQQEARGCRGHSDRVRIVCSGGAHDPRCIVFVSRRALPPIAPAGKLATKCSTRSHAVYYYGALSKKSPPIPRSAVTTPTRRPDTHGAAQRSQAGTCKRNGECSGFVLSSPRSFLAQNFGVPKALNTIEHNQKRQNPDRTLSNAKGRCVARFSSHRALCPSSLEKCRNFPPYSAIRSRTQMHTFGITRKYRTGNFQAAGRAIA